MGITDEEYLRQEQQAQKAEKEQLYQEYGRWRQAECHVKTTPALFLEWVHYLTEHEKPDYPDRQWEYGMQIYQCSTSPGEMLNGWMWNVVMFPYPPPDPGKGHALSSVSLTVCQLSPERSLVTLSLRNFLLGRWYDRLQALVCAHYPEAVWSEQPPSGAPPPGEQGQAVEELTDHEKTMLQLWGDKYTAEEIASWPGISWSAGTIRNKLTELRKALGEERVPYHRK